MVASLDTATADLAVMLGPDLAVQVAPELELGRSGRGPGVHRPQRTAVGAAGGGSDDGAPPTWGRLAVFLDLENLLHPWSGTPIEQVRRLFGLILDQVEALAPVTMIVAAGDRRLLPRLVPIAAARGVRLFPNAPGPDAADRVLLHHLGQVPASVDGVVIGSGDHGFAGAMRSFAGSCDAIVLAQFRKLAGELRDAVDWYVPLGMLGSRRQPTPVRTRPGNYPTRTAAAGRRSEALAPPNSGCRTRS